MIVAFLKTLTGDQPRFEMPLLPPSTPETPRPVPFGQSGAPARIPGPEVQTRALPGGYGSEYSKR